MWERGRRPGWRRTLQSYIRNIDTGHFMQELSEELGIKDSTLRRWACEYEEMGDDAFPGNGSPRINKDYEIVKLKKRIEELERENGPLKNFRAFLSQDHARGSGPQGA